MCILFFSKWRKTVEQILIPFLKNLCWSNPQSTYEKEKEI